MLLYLLGNAEFLVSLQIADVMPRTKPETTCVSDTQVYKITLHSPMLFLPFFSFV